MKNNKHLKLAIIAVLTASFFTSCKDDMDVEKPQEDQNEEEVITSMEVHLTDSANGTKSMFAFRDPDGDGGDAPTVFDTIKITENTVYYAEILLLDESGSAVDTISHEVVEEAADHLLCYSSASNSITIDVTDTDGALPLGLESTWRTRGSDTSSLNMVLKHQPGIKTGSCDLGETDVDLNFVLQIIPD